MKYVLIIYTYYTSIMKNLHIRNFLCLLYIFQMLLLFSQVNEA